MRGYHGGHDAKDCEALVVSTKKLRLQHRSTPPSEATPDIVQYKPWKKKLLLKQLRHAAQNNAAPAASE